MKFRFTSRNVVSRLGLGLQTSLKSETCSLGLKELGLGLPLLSWKSVADVDVIYTF